MPRAVLRFHAAELIRSGQRKSGPVTWLQNMNDVERRALWEYLAALPPMPYGAR